jgi:hypothetical protein
MSFEYVAPVAFVDSLKPLHFFGRLVSSSETRRKQFRLHKDAPRANVLKRTQVQKFSAALPYLLPSTTQWALYRCMWMITGPE